ncbi:MAG: cytidine deaminase [Candidatus Portnoybacteria bacterium]|nr:cytidine deaminase [Candidatus Portnoybacteria bacterium]
MPRPLWEETWMEIAEVFARRSICKRYNVGAVFSLGNKFITAGYNGPPKGIVHCSEVGCAKETGDNGGSCRGAHAEMNGIVNAANQGVKIAGSTLTCTWRPCLECAKHLINAQVARIVYKNYYDKEPEAIEMLKASGIEIFQFDLLLRALGKEAKE